MRKKKRAITAIFGSGPKRPRSETPSESQYLKLLPEPLDLRPTTAVGGNDPDIQRAISDLKSNIASHRQPTSFPSPNRKTSLVDFTPITPVAARRRKLRSRHWILGGGGVFFAAFLLTLVVHVFSSEEINVRAEGSLEQPIQVLVTPLPDDSSLDTEETSADNEEVAEMAFEPEVVRRRSRRSTKRRSTESVDDIISAAAAPRRSKRRARAARANVDDILAAGME